MKWTFSLLILVLLHESAIGQTDDNWLKGRFESGTSSLVSDNGDAIRVQRVPIMEVTSENSWARIQDEDEEYAPGQPRTNLETERYEMSLLNRPLELIDVDIRDFSAVHPEDQSADMLANGSTGMFPRYFEPRTVYWRAADICYQPLYFEDVLLERYGQTACPAIQPYVSAAHFFTSAALLPINMWREDPCGCEFPLGFCLPGNCTPSMKQRLLID